jgi:hypothetical protein
MANLSDILDDLITQVAKGRAQADMGTLEIANIYKDHPLLSEFPIPRMSLDKVDFEIKMSLASTTSSKTILTKESKLAIMNQFKTVLTTLIIEEPSLSKFINKSPKLQSTWDTKQDAVLKKLSNLFSTNTEIKTKSYAHATTSIIVNHILNTVTSPKSEIETKNIRTFLDKDVNSIENNLETRIEKIIDKSMQIQSADKGALEVLVTASELENINPEKITTVKLTLSESDRNWTRFETEEGIKEKLIPY